MIKFALKLFLFLIPFFIILTIEGFIDPYNYFSEEHDPQLLKLKENISQKGNMYLYKLIKYERNPDSIIILGDSRMNLLTPSLFENLGKEKVANLAIGGGTIQDAIEIFRYISDKYKIKKIYWGVSIEHYNGTRLRNGAAPSIKIKNSLMLYMCSRYTFSSTMLICRSILLNEQIDLYKPPFSKEIFWQNQLDILSQYLKNYSYPDNYYNDFKEISNYCSKQNIKLVFVITPTHFDLQKKVLEFNLGKEYDRFKFDLESFGDIYDFNYSNAITTNKNNYNDPFHYRDSISEIIVKEISTNDLKFAKFTLHTDIHDGLKEY